MIKDSSPKYRDIMLNILISIIILSFFGPVQGIAVESKQEAVEISWRKFYYHFIRNEVVKGSVKNKDNHVTGELLLETGSIFFFIPSHIQHSYKDKRNGYYDAASSYALLLSEEHSDVERKKARKWLKEYTGQIFNSNDEWEDWYKTYKNYLPYNGLRIYKAFPEHYWSNLIKGDVLESKDDGKGNLIVLMADSIHSASYLYRFQNRNLSARSKRKRDCELFRRIIQRVGFSCVQAA